VPVTVGLLVAVLVGVMVGVAVTVARTKVRVPVTVGGRTTVRVPVTVGGSTTVRVPVTVGGRTTVRVGVEVMVDVAAGAIAALAGGTDGWRPIVTMAHAIVAEIAITTVRAEIPMNLPHRQNPEFRR
jgi:hypothetical protein